MSMVQVSGLESLMLEKICSLGCVMRVGYIDDGREVTVLIVHDDDPGRVSRTIDEIADTGIEIEDEVPDRMITPLEINDGPDLPEGIIADSKVIYERAAPAAEWYRGQSEHNRGSTSGYIGFAQEMRTTGR